jgi:hypothetical protein
MQCNDLGKMKGYREAKDPRKDGPRHVAAISGRYTHDVGNKDDHNAKTVCAISYGRL